MNIWIKLLLIVAVFVAAHVFHWSAAITCIFVVIIAMGLDERIRSRSKA